MTTNIDNGYARIRSELETVAQGSVSLPNTVHLNASLRSLFGEVEGNSTAYLNVIEDDGRILDTLIGPGDGREDEISQAGVIEFILREPDPDLRETRFTDGMKLIGATLRALRTDAAFDDLEIVGIERANLAAGPLPGIKAARITFAFLFTAPDLFGNFIEDD